MSDRHGDKDDAMRQASAIHRYYASQGFPVEVVVESTRWGGKEKLADDDESPIHFDVTWGARIVTPIACLPRRLRDAA